MYATVRLGARIFNNDLKKAIAQAGDRSSGWGEEATSAQVIPEDDATSLTRNSVSNPS